jgi:hypothetical protein
MMSAMCETYQENKYFIYTYQDIDVKPACMVRTEVLPQYMS